MLKATIEICDGPGERDRRNADDTRIAVDCVSTLRKPDGAPIVIKVENFSARGFAFNSRDCDLAAGTQVCVGLDGAGTQKAVIVWRSDHVYGCEFLEPLTRERMAKAFTKASIARGRFPKADDEVPGPVVEKWPHSVRLALLAAGAVGSWALLYAIVKHVFL